MDPGHHAETTSSMPRSSAPTEDAGGGLPGAGGSGTLLVPGELVGRYRIRRLIGEGGMGHVYLARDVTLGRSVALKFVRPDRLSAGDLDRFITEARTVARLNHPHIVVLYDVSEHRGAPYLALEYLDGESLEERALRERLSIDEVLRLARAIADALAHAHAAGVRHCDLKPSNVVLPDNGRIRVVDFGLALADGSDIRSENVAGTPDWMAPEQWRADPLTDRVDVWALGVLVYQLLAGVHPFGACRRAAERRAVTLDPARLAPPLVRAGLDHRVAELVAGSLLRDPAARPSCREWCNVLDAVLAPISPLHSEASPYRGLAAFEEAHAHVFFGREAETEAFLERLRGAPVLPIVGPSGAGKSSFLTAGVIPRLRAREPWSVITLRPGVDPFVSLASPLVLLARGESDAARTRVEHERAAETLAAALRVTPTLLALRLSMVAAASGGRVLLMVDQLEELFTHDLPEADVQAFLQLLAAASDDPADPVRAVFTLRDDFLGRVPDLRQLFVLRKLGRDELRRTIVGPLERTPYRFEAPSMIEQILNEVGDAAVSLPLLQFVCRALWDSRDTERHLLLHASYERLGGVAGALARHADACMAELSADEQRVARQILVRLVAGTTARRVVDRVVLLGGLGAGASRVLDRLLSARLVAQRRAQGTEGFLVELAHESLLQSWEQLSRWIDESRDERRLLDELEEAATLWDRRGRRLDETWSADELVLARGRIRQLAVTVPPDVELFLCEGERRHMAARRRSRLRRAAVALLAALVTIGSIALASEFRKQKLSAEGQAAELRLAAGNLGRVDFILRPFDWIGGEARPAAPADLPRLALHFHTAAPGNVHRPGPPIDRAHTERLAGAAGTEAIERADVPGGLVFLRIDGRGRGGEECAPSWVRLQSLPGWAERARPRSIPLEFPTCQASAAGMVKIPAGPFIYGGPGDPPTPFPEYVEPERTVSLGTYWIDRTEVSNAVYRAFAALELHSGYPAPIYPTEGRLAHAGDPEIPVTSIDAFTAEAFCRFMGKRLPGEYEWVKAARGALELNGQPNPHPRRLYPWGVRADQPCANLEGGEDGAEWVAPAESFLCGASPYGVINLAGNVDEWMSREGQVDQASRMRIVRGGAAASPPSLQHGSTVYSNPREARHFDFSIGVRCVTERLTERGASSPGASN